MTDDDTRRDDSKLTRSKREWADKKRFLTGRIARPDAERLPPGQHVVTNWPVLDLGNRPEVPRETWTLTIDGLVANPVTLDWAGLMALPQTRSISDIHCVTSWSRYDNAWDGVATRDLLDLVRPLPEATAVTLHGADRYDTNLRIEDFAAADALVAHQWSGKPLTRDHGGPARLIVPHLYLWKSAKWLNRIEFRAIEEPGFWEVNGYHMRGDPWTEQRYED
ncbi:MAG: putative oxidoreductase [Sphingomonas bacterium]|nr:sulfite oxidase-like oxidoreductase [Sphingomonas bacterium]MDB5688794.1 putative oxidoreductase [Sphingomonas bacterium]